MKANASQLRQAIDAANPAIRLYLLHGPDESGAREWAARLGRAMGPDAERVDLDGATLKSDPGRLATEAASLSLFGGARHIRVAAMGEESADAIALLLQAEQAGNPVVAIAPSVKASGKLVKLAIAAPAAMAFPCYVPTGADAGRLAAAIAGEHGMRTNGPTAARLFAASGGDRAVLTREIEKLALYLDAAPERPMTLDDASIDAVGADLGDAEISRVVEAALDGEVAVLGAELALLDEAGVSPIPLLRALVRRFMLLAELRGDVDAGVSINDVIERHNVFFKEKAGTARALRLWTSLRITIAIDRLRQAERALMSAASAGDVIAQSACLAIARTARSQR